MSAAATPSALLTFPPMIDSELCHFLLNHFRIAYRHEPHLFIWVSILALFRGGTVRVPMLTGADKSIAGPRALVDHFDALCPPERRLIPADHFLATEVQADFLRYNHILGFATAVIGYYHLLPHRDLMVEPFSRGLPKGEAKWLASHYSMLAGVFKVMLRLNAQNARAALTQTRAIMDETDRRLADGRAYLIENRLTLSDMALATALAPVLLPPGYDSPLPAFDDMPAELQAIISELRQRETARFVERIFRMHRNG